MRMYQVWKTCEKKRTKRRKWFKEIISSEDGSVETKQSTLPWGAQPSILELISATPQWVYPMTAKKIGYHAILNMLTCRKKVHKNVELIQGAFHKRMGFCVEEYAIQKKENYEDSMKQIGNKALTEYNTIFVTVIAIGNDEDWLSCEDEKGNIYRVCRLDNICNEFDNIRDPKDKPVVILYESHCGHSGLVQSYGRRLVTRRQMKDMLMICAATGNYVSNVEVEKGTQFIQTFVEHIESDYKNRCLETMCVDIIAEVNQMIGDGKREFVPEIYSTLTKKLDFFEHTKRKDILKNELTESYESCGFCYLPESTRQESSDGCEKKKPIMFLVLYPEDSLSYKYLMTTQKTYKALPFHGDLPKVMITDKDKEFQQSAFGKNIPPLSGVSSDPKGNIIENLRKLLDKGEEYNALQESMAVSKGLQYIGRRRNMLYMIMNWACKEEMESWQRECWSNPDKKNECAEYFLALAENIGRHTSSNNGGSTSYDECNIFMEHADPYERPITKDTANEYFRAHLNPHPNSSSNSEEIMFKYLTVTPDCRIYWPMEHLVNIQLILFEVKSNDVNKPKDKLRFCNNLVKGLLYSQKTAGIMLYPYEFIFIELLRLDEECEIRRLEATYNLTDSQGRYNYASLYAAQKHIFNLVGEARLQSKQIQEEYTNCPNKVPEFTNF